MKQSQQFNWFNYFVNYAKEAHMYTDSTLFAFVGRKRSGKSMAALAMCKMIDPDFSEENIVFDVEDFGKLVKEKSNTAILWDEASVTAYSRDFMKDANKILNKVIQVYGYKKVSVCCTFQHLNFLDKHTRQVVDLIFRCYYQRKKTEDGQRIQQSFLHPYTVVTDWIRDPYLDEYKVNRDGVFKPVGPVPLPQIQEFMDMAGVDKQLMKAYNKKKDEFFNTVGEEKEEEKTKSKRPTKKELVLPGIKRLVADGQYTAKDACNMFGISEEYYCRNKDSVKI